MKIEISGKARADLTRMYDYLAARNPSAAERLLTDIDRKLVQLSRFPFIGRDRSDMAANLRSAVVRTVLIFYACSEERVLIIRVIDGRMDVDAEFHQ
ncbi:MAG: type II toxin-antitoxin system RelE/ParE family toxin [Bryobacteraceae bacterium]